MGNTDSTLDDQLRDACYDNDHDKVVQLVGAGANIDAQGGGGWTPLHNAVVHGHQDISRFLIGSNCDVNIAADNGSTSLHVAAYYGHHVLVDLLIEHGADLYKRDRSGNTPLDEARKKAESSVLAILDVAIEEDFIKFFDIDPQRAKNIVHTMREHDESIIDLPSLQRFYDEVKGEKDDEHEALKELGIAKVADRIVIIKALKYPKQKTTTTTTSASPLAIKAKSIVKPASVKPSENSSPRTVVDPSLRSSLESRSSMDSRASLEPIKKNLTSSMKTIPPPLNTTSSSQAMIEAPSLEIVEAQVVQSQVMQPPITETGPKTLPLPNDYKYHAFLTHNWGYGDCNHKRVSVINHYLKNLGVVTWFDEDRMQGNIANQMSRGINNSLTVIVFITEDYITKVAGEAVNGDNDNCKLEFEYACEHKGVNNLILVEMEETNKPWRGSVGLYAGKILSYSYKKNRDLVSCIRSLMNEIEQRIDDVHYIESKAQCDVSDGDETVERCPIPDPINPSAPCDNSIRTI